MLGDEVLGPAFEDVILIQVLQLIDSMLLSHVRAVYSHKINKKKRIMDLEANIFMNVKKILGDI
jgi:hypothetical protein